MLGQLVARINVGWAAVQKIRTYFPFRFYLFAFVIFSLAAHLLLKQQFHSEPSAFNDMLAALIKLIKTVMVPLLAIGFATVLFPFLLFWWVYRKRLLAVTIESPSLQPEGLKQELKFSISPLWQPFFGHIYFRLLYDKGRKRSPKFTLVRRENLLGYAGKKQEGWYRWPLPGIREYEIDTMVIYLEDFFHFFKLAMPVKVNQAFFTRPSTKASQILDIDPSKTEYEAIRIKDWRKVQGEMLHYKHFESNDDVRRIVWKIYARNKELVVRTNEILNPFASHVSFYVSFFDNLDTAGSHAIGHSCLDFYKAACWTLYRQLDKQGLKTHFFTDQPVPQLTAKNEEMEVEYALAVSKWQQTTRPEEAVKLKDATLICISSLADPKDVIYLTENAPNSLTIALVPLSAATPFPTGWNRLKWLLIETEKDPAYKDNFVWFLSPVRKAMIENERKIIRILEQSGTKYIYFNTEA
jgi:hypothetical protein